MQQRDAITMLVRGEVTAPTAVVEIAAIASVPDLTEAWVRSTLARDIVPPRKLRIDSADEMRCHDGWLGHILVGVVHEEHQIYEARCGVYLRLFDDLGTSVLVRAGTAADLDTAMKELLPQLVAGTPDWRADGEVIAISQLFAP
jgi:hypothetical protein